MVTVQPQGPRNTQGKGRWSTTKATLVGALIGGLLAGIPAGVSAWVELVKYNDEVVRRQHAEATVATYQQAYEAAAEKFTNTLGLLIDEASIEAKKKDEPSDLIAATKALVSSRDSFRSDLEDIGKRLDGEIDALSAQLQNNPPDQVQISIIVETLKRRWPAKKQEIDLAARKLLTELGLDLVLKGTPPPPSQGPMQNKPTGSNASG
jgi:hypothetical protein